MFGKSIRCITPLGLITLFLSLSVVAQESNNPVPEATVTDQGSVIVIGPTTPPPPVPVFFRARTESKVSLYSSHASQEVSLSLEVIQGEAEQIQLEVIGTGSVVSVSGEGVISYAIRNVGKQRFLELEVDAERTSISCTVQIKSAPYQLPATWSLTHFGPADAVGFDSRLELEVEDGVVAKFTDIKGFSRLDTSGNTSQFQTSTGGLLSVELSRSVNSPEPVEITEASLSGVVAADQQSIELIWEAKASVQKAGATLDLFSGEIALKSLPSDSNVRLQLVASASGYRYRATFLKAGEIPMKLTMLAPVQRLDGDRLGIDFRVASGAVVPFSLTGLQGQVSFVQGKGLLVPRLVEDRWQGFLPADGTVKMNWKVDRATGEGKLFFSTSGQIEARVGSGLLRQDHRLTYQVLQGELKSLRLQIQGPGEILDVQGANLVSWKVTSEGESKQLEVNLAKPLTGTSELIVRSQTALGSFPLEVQGMSLVPDQAIRHSGFLRISNVGSVRVEPTEITGLTQLAPEQFPGEPLKARQEYVYRFPSSSHAFTVNADRIQPEVNLSELIQYELRETEKLILADIELDIREAPIRDWSFEVPADYSVVSVTGANVTDYLVGTDAGEGVGELKVLFGQDVIGRQLITLHLEKSEIAQAEDWKLPRIQHPNAKSTRGDVGIVGAPGYRLALSSTELLVEKPLSYFPRPTPNLQHAFRMRESGWSAVVNIEQLDRSVQSDVFHLYSLSEENIYGSALINYFITGAPVSELKIHIPEELKNEVVDGQDVQDSRRSGEELTVTLHQPVMGPYTLLITFEEKAEADSGRFSPGSLQPLGVQGERGYIQVVSPMQVEMAVQNISSGMLSLDPLELPDEFRLLSTAPTLGAWQYSERPYEVDLSVKWFKPGSTVGQVVEFAEVDTTISQDGEQVTQLLYFVKSRGQRSLKIKLPESPVRLWEVSVGGNPVTARQTEEFTLIPLPASVDPNEPIQVSLRLGKPAVRESKPTVALPQVSAPILKTQWSILGDEQRVISPAGGTVDVPQRLLPMTGFEWVARYGLFRLTLCMGLMAASLVLLRADGGTKHLALVLSALAIYLALDMASQPQGNPSEGTGFSVNLPILSAGESVRLDLYNMPRWRASFSMMGFSIGLLGLVGAVASALRKYDEYRIHIRVTAFLLIALGVLFQHGSASAFYGVVAITIFLFTGVKGLSNLFRAANTKKQREESESAGEELMQGLDGVESAPIEDIVSEVTDTTEPSTKNTDEDIRMNAEAEDVSDVSDATTGDQDSDDHDSNGGGSGINGTTKAILLFLISSFCTQMGFAQDKTAPQHSIYLAADQLEQTWHLEQSGSRLVSDAVMQITGEAGDQFLVLSAPAVLTDFEGEGVKLFKRRIGENQLVYVVSILETEDPAGNPEEERTEQEAGGFSGYTLRFSYQLESFDASKGIPVPTGDAAVNELVVDPRSENLEIRCDRSVASESMGDDGLVKRFVLGPGKSVVTLTPRRRDFMLEETKFFVEGLNLYIPTPGVVTGIHRFDLRTSQGVIDSLSLLIPGGFTVSQVSGPVASWQFDADQGVLNLAVAPAQSKPFSITVETQRGLDNLPSDLELSPIQVRDADGEVGLLGIAFDGDAQPDQLVENQLSVVNIGDFDSALLAGRPVSLYRVYRYGDQGGDLSLSVAPVAPEVRVTSKQVLSLGDERVMLGINLTAEISRAGLFKLSFVLPAGFEVESLSGPSLHHWSEITEDDTRKVVMHLNGKTLGTQSFALSLTAATPDVESEWELPRVLLEEAVRQTGELIVQPATGIRLKTISKQNISEVDPRALGSATNGAVAYRLLQDDWRLSLGIEKLDSRISGDVLLETDLREGQTRTILNGSFDVQNASIRTMQVRLPITDPDEIKTLRVSGTAVSDLIQVEGNADLWEIQFKRRVLGRVNFRIESERRGDRAENQETLRLAAFPGTGQVNFYYAVRTRGRLELSIPENLVGWNKMDWSAVPNSLRSSSMSQAPIVVLRVQKSAEPVTIDVQRHSLADALKLRVADGMLTSVLAPNGDQITSVQLGMEVIQRSSLTVGLPRGGEIFSIFVNGESVNSIRLDRESEGGSDRWQFYVLPGIDGRTAEVKFIYSLRSDGISSIRLTSPVLNVPLENIQWNVVAPQGYELADHDGNADLVSQKRLSQYDRTSYLQKSSLSRQLKREQAENTLQQANEFLQQGEQNKANMLFNSAANQYGLDAASNEDARIQLENLQTRQAIVGLNTRRQRVFLDNDRDEISLEGTDQLRQAAENNPILQQGTMNFQLQEMSQLLRGNSSEDNAVLERIAGRLVQHQRTTEPAPQAIVISLPEEGEVYTFSRSVQVAENSPLELDLDFSARLDLPFTSSLMSLIVLLFGAVVVVWSVSTRKS